MLVLEPAGTQPQVDAATAHGVDLRDADGEGAGVAEGGGGDQRAEPDGRRLTSQAGQGDPRVGGAGQPVAAHCEVMVGSEEGTVAEFLRGCGDPEEVVVGGALLRFGEDA